MLNNIKSNYILKIVIRNHLLKKKYFQLVKKNKNLQQKLEINLDDYKEYYTRIFNRIEFEIIPISKLPSDDKYYFIKMRENIKYYHIYFNNDKNEIKRNYITNKDKVKKIIVKIDMELKSLRGLFADCTAPKEIKFTKFNREDFTDMTELFYGCGNLVELDIQKFKTPNVTKMNWMFAMCHYLKELNILNFDTSNVNDMECLFSGCISLKELKFNFNTQNVTNMRNMFYKCKSLKEINVSNFDTTNVNNFNAMFYECSNIDYLNLENFRLDKKYITFTSMFELCNNKLKENIKKQYKIGENGNFLSLFEKVIYY